MTILSIAQQVADDIALARPETLFPVQQDDTARRLLRAITAVARHLGATYDWQQLQHDHVFRSISGPLQPGALPVDFLRFIEGTIVDRTRKLQFCRGNIPSEWASRAMWGFTQMPWQWRQQGNDLYMLPAALPDSEIFFSYVSKNIGRTTTAAPEIVYTTNQQVLVPGKRYVVRANHVLGVPTLQPGQFIELVPEAGTWLRLNATLVFQDDAALFPDTLPDSSDIITISRRGAGHQITTTFGQYAPYVEEAVNGQTLEAGKRYIVDTGQLLYVPVLRSDEWIELTPKLLSWRAIRTRLITRSGLTVSETLNSFRDGIVSIRPDMSATTNYTISEAPIAMSDQRPSRLINTFTRDDDEALWDEELMILGTIWRINHRDGQPYNEDFRNFERMAYDRYKGEGHQGIISQRSLSGDPISSRIRGMRNAAIVISDPQTWEVPR